MAQQENTPAGCSKRPDFSPAQPLRAETRLVPGKAAASEGPRRYKPHFVWAVRPCKWVLANGKAPQWFRHPRGSLLYVEGLNDARTKLADFFSILLESHVDNVGNPQVDDLRGSRARLNCLRPHAQGSILADSLGKPHDHVSIS